MIDHITVRVGDLEKGKEFYAKAFAPLGYVVGMEEENSVGFCAGNKRDFWIVEDATGQEPHAFSCLAFGASNKEAVDEFFKAAIEAGGKEHLAPGYKTEYHPGYYAAFVYDLDGHNIEAVYDDWEEAGKPTNTDSI